MQHGHDEGEVDRAPPIPTSGPPERREGAAGGTRVHHGPEPSAQLLGVVVANAPVTLMALDRDGIITLLEGRGLAAWGVAPGALVGRSIFALFPDQPEIAAHARRALAGEALTTTLERRGVVVETRWTPVRDAAGAVAAVVAVATDISERARAERALRESEARQAAILRAIPDLIFRISRAGEYLDVRASREGLLYVPPEAIVGRTVGELLPPEVARASLAAIARALESGTPQVMEYQLPVPDGPHYFEARLVVSGPDEVLSMVRDITEPRRAALERAAAEAARARSEAALRRSEERFRTLVEAAPVGICVLSAQGRFAAVNDAYCALTGYAREELLGREVGDLHPPEEREAHLTQLRARFAAGRSDPVEFTLLTKQGERRAVLGRGATVAGPGGQPQRLGFVVDITARKRAEEALRASEERYRRIVETADEGIMQTDLKGCVRFLNQRIADIVGFSRAEMLDRPILTWVAGEDRAAVRARLASRRRGERDPFRYEVRIKRKDGSLVWAAVSESAVTDSVGRVVGALGLLTDITARKRAEEVQARLAALVASTSDAVIGGTPDGTITSWNGGAERLYGYTAAEAIGRPVAMLADPGAPDAAAPLAVHAVLRGGESIVDLDTVRRHKDGSAVPVSISASPVLDGGGAIVGIVGTHRDISARKAAEEALARANAELARANAELETVLRVLPIGIGIADDPGVTHIRMNPAFARLLGLPPGANASLGAPEGERPTTFRVLQGGRELAAEELPFNVAAATGREVRDLELEVVREDGMRLTQLVNVAPLFDEQGRVRGVVGAHLDITALRELDRARDGFLLAAAHDLRTPLTVILGRMQLAQRDLVRLRAPELAPVVAQLGRALERADGMLALIRELGEVARHQMGGTLDLQPRPTDLVALVRATAEAQRVVSGRTIDLETEEAELRAEVDPERMGRVVGNLLANAIKYSPPGKAIRVRLGRERGPGGPEAVLSVHDEGIGIPAADLPHIFERFRRGSNVVGRVEGTGIGLASARAIVEQHGGRIAAESTEGAGATFTVRLPLAPRGSTGEGERGRDAGQGEGPRHRFGPAR